MIDAIEASLSAGEYPSIPIGISRLIKMAFDGHDLAPLWNRLVERVNQFPGDAAAFIDLSTIAHIQGRPDHRSILQERALELQRIYKIPHAAEKAESIRLLAFMAPGDFLANMPIEFLLEDSGVTLHMVYVVPGQPLPQPLPDHDVALVAVSESNANQAVLRELSAVVASWPRPIINTPDRIARLTRDGTWELLNAAPGVAMPINVRIERSEFVRIARGDSAIEGPLLGAGFPIIARPLDSHAGEGLCKLDCPRDVDDYLRERAELEFYIAPFIDYRGKDGLFRKYRIALIGGKPYACHMAISDHWMIHYLNADMRKHADRRAEEAKFIAEFDTGFALRHQVALGAIAERVGLEYLPFDCGETQDGKLLIFETGTNMVVHSMDPPDLFPYKPLQMEKVFQAFHAMLQNACKR